MIEIKGELKRGWRNVGIAEKKIRDTLEHVNKAYNGTADVRARVLLFDAMARISSVSESTRIGINLYGVTEIENAKTD